MYVGRTQFILVLGHSITLFATMSSDLAQFFKMSFLNYKNNCLSPPHPGTSAVMKDPLPIAPVGTCGNVPLCKTQF